MIHDMLKAFVRATGVEPTPEQVRQIEFDVITDYGGQRVYIPALPKRKRAVQLARLELRTTRELAAASGIPARTVRRLRSGR